MTNPNVSYAILGDGRLARHMRHYLELHYDGFRIWGVTAAIIANLARRIAPEELADVR